MLFSYTELNIGTERKWVKYLKFKIKNLLPWVSHLPGAIATVGGKAWSTGLQVIWVKWKSHWNDGKDLLDQENTSTAFLKISGNFLSLTKKSKMYLYTISTLFIDKY